MELKTGALMGFAMVLGAVTAKATEAVTSLVDELGRDLGIALQMFDDLGNVSWAFANPPRSMRTSRYIGLRGHGGAPQEAVLRHSIVKVCSRGGQVAGRP